MANITKHSTEIGGEADYNLLKRQILLLFLTHNKYLAISKRSRLKQLKQLVLFISCLFLLPLLAAERHRTAASAHELLISSPDVSHAPAHFFLSEKIQRFSYRTKALNDFHQYFVFVSSIRIKPLFVFIRSYYKGHTQSYISAAISLNQWRGPPTA
jgi:hypothetical protein